MQWRSFEDKKVLFLCERDASADIVWTRFGVRRVAIDGLSKSGSRDPVEQDAPEDGLQRSMVLQWILEVQVVPHYSSQVY